MHPKNILNADLHCHSVVSDGTLTPEVLAERAKTSGVELWALLTTMKLAANTRAMAAAKAQGMAYLTGTDGHLWLKTGLFQDRAQLGVVLQQRFGNSVFHGSGLTGRSSAVHIDIQIKLIFLPVISRLFDDHLQTGTSKIIIKSPFVDDKITALPAFM